MGTAKLSHRVSEMIELAEELGKCYDYVRVDLMLSHDDHGCIAFSELTPYPMSGCAKIIPHSWDQYLGSLW
jgi:hypothetical protein